MTAHLAGVVVPGRILTPRQIVPIWVVADGIVLGSPGWKTRGHLLGQKSGWQVFVDEDGVHIADVLARHR